MIGYVCGFLFDLEASQVALIQKSKPEWQAGKWNGIGGKLEAHGETWNQAMTREFCEETGVYIDPLEWVHTVTLYNDEFECRFFRAFSDEVFEVKTIELEPVSIWDLERLIDCPVIDNLKWLIPLQLEKNVVFPIVLEASV